MRLRPALLWLTANFGCRRARVAPTNILAGGVRPASSSSSLLPHSSVLLIFPKSISVLSQAPLPSSRANLTSGNLLPRVISSHKYEPLRHITCGSFIIPRQGFYHRRSRCALRPSSLRFSSPPRVWLRRLRRELRPMLRHPRAARPPSRHPSGSERWRILLSRGASPPKRYVPPSASPSTPSMYFIHILLSHADVIASPRLPTATSSARSKTVSSTTNTAAPALSSQTANSNSTGPRKQAQSTRAASPCAAMTRWPLAAALAGGAV